MGPSSRLWISSTSLTQADMTPQLSSTACARRAIAQQSPFKDWIKREICPGPKVNTDEELSEYARRVAHTVYHPAGTTKMGDVRADEMAVCDPEMKVRGLQGLRICDAGLFPAMTSINPMVTVLSMAERGAEMVARAAGWDGHVGVLEATPQRVRSRRDC